MKSSFFSEFIGTCFLLMIVVGSGIMGENLANENQAIALLANSLATGFGLFVLIQSLHSFSGAHFNPLVSIFEVLCGGLKKNKLFFYLFALLLGAIFGVLITHFIFGEEIFQVSTKVRSGVHFAFSEVLATFGLISVIYLNSKKDAYQISMIVGAYISCAYWFTSSTSFANPAVNFPRTQGIREVHP